MIDATGERTFITSPGSEESLREADLASLDVRGDDYVLVSGYNVMYPGQAERVLHWLATLSEETVVAFDPSNRVADIPVGNLDEILGRADWVLLQRNRSGDADGRHDDRSVVGGARVSFRSSRRRHSHGR